jgi:hypothetical protein
MCICKDIKISGVPPYSTVFEEKKRQSPSQVYKEKEKLYKMIWELHSPTHIMAWAGTMRRSPNPMIRAKM